jgi:hypothetical protein
MHEWLRLAEAHALIGDRDAAIDALERCVRAGYDDVFYLWIDPKLAALRDDPRLEALIETRPD